MMCPVCNGHGTVLHNREGVEIVPLPCPRCRPAAPGRILKSVPERSLGAEEIARELSEELHPE